MPRSADACNQLMEEYRAYLETLTFIQISPRLRGLIGMSDIIQNTLVAAWRDLARIKALDVKGQKRRLRLMLEHKWIDAIRAIKPEDLRTKSLDGAAEESIGRLQGAVAVEDTSPSERLIKEEEALLLLEALSKLDPRQREALILQKYHGWTLAQIAEHLSCTTGAVAGLHARGLKKLREHLTEMGISHV